ncbi:hypothetical protein HZC31_00540 [Candidatus Woesearchaeota archaeon]|nr:hypothetical protein [Candidatus Woesearchaeota archaeon]
MSADEKFDYIDRAEYQYEKYCKIVLGKKRLNESEIEVMMAALEVEKGFGDGVRYLLRQGSSGYGDSCAFSRAMRKNWQRVPFPIPEERRDDVQRLAEMDVDTYYNVRFVAPKFALYQYKSLSDILGVNDSYCGPAENPFAVEIPDLLINATVLFESDKIPMNLCNAELFSETLRQTWRQIPVTGETQRKLEEIAEMRIEQYQRRK